MTHEERDALCISMAVKAAFHSLALPLLLYSFFGPVAAVMYICFAAIIYATIAYDRSAVFWSIICVELFAYLAYQITGLPLDF